MQNQILTIIKKNIINTMKLLFKLECMPLLLINIYTCTCFIKKILKPFKNPGALFTK